MNLNQKPLILDSASNELRVHNFFENASREANGGLGGAFRIKDSGEVLVKLFPRTGIFAAMSIRAAGHLVNLLQRYNWANSVPAEYADRWQQFWSRTTTIERAIVEMYVCSANDGQFRGTVNLNAIPVAVLQAVENERRIDADVAKEYASLRHVFVCKLVTLDDIISNWWLSYKPVMQEHEDALFAALQDWIASDGMFDLHDFVRPALFSDGMTASDANFKGTMMALTVGELIRDRERALCAGTVVRAVH